MGFTPSSLPLERLILDSQQKGKENLKIQSPRKNQEFRRLIKNCFSLTKHVPFESGLKINLLYYLKNSNIETTPFSVQSLSTSKKTPQKQSSFWQGTIQ